MASETNEPELSEADAFLQKFFQMLLHAVNVLIDRGILNREDVRNFPEGEWWAHIEEQCFEFLETQEDVDDYTKPRRVEVAAALMIPMYAEMLEAFSVVSENAKNGDASGDDLCALLHVVAELGALGEVFRGDIGGFDPVELKELPARHGAKGGRARRESANEWRVQAIGLAVEFRGSIGGQWGWDPLTAKVKAALADRGIKKSEDTIVRLLKNSTDPKGPIPQRRS